MDKPTNLKKHEAQNPIQKALIRNFYTALFNILPSYEYDKVLDAGCGEGFTLQKFFNKRIGRELIGIDNSIDSIRIGHGMHSKLDLSVGSIYKIEYPNDYFDLVICTEVLEHLKDPRMALKELHRVTKKYCLISVPNEPFFILANLIRLKYVKTLGNHPEHINHWSFWGIEKFTKACGFSLVASKHPFAWTMLLLEKA